MSVASSELIVWVGKRVAVPVLLWFTVYVLAAMFGASNEKAAADFVLNGTLFLVLYMAVRGVARLLWRSIRQSGQGLPKPTAWPDRGFGAAGPREDDAARSPRRWSSSTESNRSEHARALAASDPRWFEGEEGQSAKFQYVDVDGVVTDREVRNWKSSGAHIRGYCLDRRDNRTFRKDRISSWQA